MYYGNVTFVMALPRSRTAWLARVFCDGGINSFAIHDPLKKCASIDDLGKLIDHNVRLDPRNALIIVDTATKFFYPQIAERFPGARYCFIERGVLEVADSLRSAGQPVHGEVLAEAHDYLRRAQERARAEKRFVYRVHFDDLDCYYVLENLWKFFGINVPPPEGFFAEMVDLNIQIPFAEQHRNTDGRKVARLMATRLLGW